MNKLGFIGMGNMAQALAAGFIESGKIAAENVYAFAPNQEKLKMNAEKIGFTPVASVQELAEKTDVLVMACKPYQIEGVLAELKGSLEGKSIISVAAGWPFDRYMQYIEENVGIQFVMPNTPAMVGEGVLLFEDKNSLSEEMLSSTKDLFGAVGMVDVLPSHLMGIGGAITGCGPAFADLFMEAYADAAVKYGIPRDKAYRFVAMMLKGSAKLQLETGTHPGVLKDNVCSPAGTTICGVGALEEAGFRSACIKSIDAIMNKK